MISQFKNVLFSQQQQNLFREKGGTPQGKKSIFHYLE